MPDITPSQWQKILGTVGVVTAILLAQTDVVLDPPVKLALVLVAGVVAYLRPGGGDGE